MCERARPLSQLSDDGLHIVPRHTLEVVLEVTLEVILEHMLGIKTMASLILDHVATDYLYLGTNTDRKIYSWNCPRTRS